MKRAVRHRLFKEAAYLVALGGGLLLLYLVASPRSNAVLLLKRLQAVRVNQTRFNQVEQLATQFGAYAACVGDNCLFQFQNQWLHRLGLAPQTEFSVMLQRGGSASDPGGGRVGAIDMAMLVSRGTISGVIASALVFDHAETGSPDPYDASITFGADGRPDRTVVTLTSGSTPRQRARARAFNLQCLTRIGGCQNSRDLLPGVWQGVRRIETVRGQPSSSKWRAASATF